MAIKDAIKQLLKDNKKSQVWLSEKMGYAKSTAVNNILARNNLTVETLCRICDIMDYEVTIQPKRRSGARPNGQIVITGSEESGKVKGKKESDGGEQ